MPADAPSQLIDRSVLRDRLLRAQADAVPDILSHPLLVRIENDMVERLSAVLRNFNRAVVASPWPCNLPVLLSNEEQISSSTGVSVLAGPAALILDDEALPFGPATLDLLISVLALQATNDLPGALVQARRSLRPDGLFIGVLMGGNTLHELRTCLLEAEAECVGGASPRVLPFADVRELGGLMQRAGFALPVADTDTIRITYETPLHLLHELRQYGASNVLCARRRAFTSRRTMMRAMEIYSDRFAEADGRVVATIDLVTLTGWAPAADQQQPLKPGSAKTRLSEALGAEEYSLRDTRLPD